MTALLYGVIAWAASSLLARVLVGAGLSLVVFTGVSVLVESLLDSAILGITGMPSDILSIMYLAGIGEALSILGSAVLSRTALVFAANVFGLRFAT